MGLSKWQTQSIACQHFCGTALACVPAQLLAIWVSRRALFSDQFLCPFWWIKEHHGSEGKGVSQKKACFLIKQPGEEPSMPRCHKRFPNSPNTYLEVGWIIVGSISGAQGKNKNQFLTWKTIRHPDMNSFLDSSAPLLPPPAPCLKPAEARRHSGMGLSSRLHSTSWGNWCTTEWPLRQGLKLGTLSVAPLK